MLLHLPIAVIATLTVAVSTVPKFDIVRECRFEGGSSANYYRCSQAEADALEELRSQWAQFVDADRSSCLSSATIGGFSSYVDLLTCLEMARDSRKPGR
jgi:hypothetical protein